MAELINGKAVAASVRAQVSQKVLELKSKGVTPGLAVVIVGDDSASRTYVNNKEKLALRLEYTQKYTHCLQVPVSRSCWI